jgi:hypothetical protein
MTRHEYSCNHRAVGGQGEVERKTGSSLSNFCFKRSSQALSTWVSTSFNLNLPAESLDIKVPQRRRREVNGIEAIHLTRAA